MDYTDIVGFGTSHFILWKMCVHFVTVEICVIGFAVGVVQTQRLFAHQNLNAIMKIS